MQPSGLACPTPCFIFECVCALQDLSVYSWLDCEPDDLFKLTNYSLYEIQDAFPHPIPDYLDYWREYGLGTQHISPWLTSLGQFTFTARPMQVGTLILPGHQQKGVGRISLACCQREVCFEKKYTPAGMKISSSSTSAVLLQSLFSKCWLRVPCSWQLQVRGELNFTCHCTLSHLEPINQNVSSIIHQGV